MKTEIMRLFKGFIGNSGDWNEEGFKYGLLIPSTADNEVFSLAVDMYGKDGEKWNKTFHKDFKTVEETPYEILVAQQIAHYFTTYGFESLGIFDHGTVYIPKEKLEIPELTEDIELVVIRAYTEKEIKEKVMTLITSGIALSKRTLSDIQSLSDFIDKDSFDSVKNRELRVFLYNKYNIMPKNPDEFLRYMIYKLTDTSLKIQNNGMCNAIRYHAKYHTDKLLKLLNAYIAQNGEEKLSSVFLRNKKLFLAMKSKPEVNSIINKLRRLADSNHKPVKKDTLSNLTDVSMEYSHSDIMTALDNATIFREIRIANALSYRLANNPNFVYKIRNGKSFATVKQVDLDMVKLEDRLSLVKDHLCNRLSKKVSGKTFYLHDDVNYMAPTSEKQFVGNIPSGTTITLNKDDDVVVGIYWKNVPSGRVDLDIHQKGLKSSFGWNSNYRSDNILFSGDITDAPNGATELFFIDKSEIVDFETSVNCYTRSKEAVPFDFVIAKGHRDKFGKNYMIDPNDIIMTVPLAMKVGQGEMSIARICIVDDIKVTFTSYSTGNSPVSYNKELINIRNSYEDTALKTRLTLKELLQNSGAIICDTPKQIIEEKFDVTDDGYKVRFIEKEVDFDLSFNKLTKDTLIGLLS